MSKPHNSAILHVELLLKSYNFEVKVMVYEIIPDAPRYELSDKGVLRNRETGRILKWSLSPHGTKFVTLYQNGKKIIKTLPHLMWQLHGQIISKTRPIPVVISKGTRVLRFDSLLQCAKHLTKYHGLKQGSCWTSLVRRQKTIGGWNIRYCY